MQNDFLERRQDESELEYKRRLLYARVVEHSIKTDFGELSTRIFGKYYVPDSARRMMYGAAYMLRLVDATAEQDAVSIGMFDRLQKEKQSIQKEKQKLSDQRREYSKLVNAQGRYEHLLSVLEKAAKGLPKTVGRVGSKDVTDLMWTDTDAVLVLTDWHYGLVADNIFNKYNKDVCLDRLRKLVADVTMRLALHNVYKLHIVVLGDLIHGAIHTSARVASEELVCDQLMQVSEILAQTIEELAENVVETEVYVTYGNHARTVQNKNDSIHRDNMERIIPWWLRYRLPDSIRITESENEFLYICAAGHGIAAAHGDLDRLKSAPRLLPELFRKQYGKEVECILLGDKHHRETIHDIGVDAIICGALCGADDYANSKRLYAKPEQTLLIFNERDGLDAEYHIKL